MGLFATLMKAGLNNYESKDNYIDVSEKPITSFPENAYDTISIKSNVSLEICKGNKHFNYRIFMKNKNDADSVSFRSEIKEHILFIEIETSKENFKGYVVVKLPKCNGLEVTNTYEDVKIKGVDITNLNILSDSGDVTVLSSKFMDAKIVTDSGDILINIDKNEYQIKVKSDAGEVIKQKVKNVADSKKVLICKSKSGDIQLNMG